MKVNTDEFSKILSNALKAAGNNSMLPITGMCHIIRGEENSYCVNVTDGTNFVSFFDSCKSGGYGIDCVVDLALLSKLVSKITTKEVEIKLDSNKLLVSGNGEYYLELCTDEYGDTIAFPEPPTVDEDTSGTVYADVIREVVSIAGSLVGKDASTQTINGYYFSDKAITTNGTIISVSNIKTFNSKSPIMLSPKSVQLMTFFDDEIKYSVSEDDATIFMRDDKLQVWCRLMTEEIEEYPIAVLNDYITSRVFNWSARVDRNNLIKAIDRVSLFVSPYDANTVNMLFTENLIMLTNKKKTAADCVGYEIALSDCNFKCLIDAQILMTQLKSLNSEIVDIFFGDDRCIKIIDENTIKIIALQGE